MTVNDILLDRIRSHVCGRLVLTVPETAAVLGMGRSAAYQAVRRGDIPSRKLGRRIVVPLAELATWLGFVDTPLVHDVDDDGLRQLGRSQQQSTAEGS
jgi:excisionase family DNA binding protein